MVRIWPDAQKHFKNPGESSAAWVNVSFVPDLSELRISLSCMFAAYQASKCFFTSMISCMSFHRADMFSVADSFGDYVLSPLRNMLFLLWRFCMQYQELQESAFVPFEGAPPDPFCLSSLWYITIYIIFLWFFPLLALNLALVLLVHVRFCFNTLLDILVLLQ